jgi:hypothetical protein
VERVCDRIGILHEGVLKEAVSISKVLESSVPVDYWVEVPSGEASKLNGLPFQEAIRNQGGVQVAGMVLGETLSLMTSRRTKINGVRPLSSIVEAYFLRSIGAQDYLNKPISGGPS